VDWIYSLRTQRLALKIDIRALYRTLKKAEHADPDRSRAHEAVVKELARVRAVYRRGKKAEFREDYFDTMPGVEIDKQIDQLLGKSPDIGSEDVIEEGILRYLNTPFWNKRGLRTLFSALMLSHSMKNEHLLDGFRSSPMWRRFVSYANRPVAESRSTGTKWRRPPTLFRIQTSKTLRP